MSQPDPGATPKTPKKAADEPAPGDGALDRDSEGVYYISIEDFERRIVPKESPAPEASPGSGADQAPRPSRS